MNLSVLEDSLIFSGSLFQSCGADTENAQEPYYANIAHYTKLLYKAVQYRTIKYIYLIGRLTCQYGWVIKVLRVGSTLGAFKARSHARYLRPVSTSANSTGRPRDGLSGHAQLEIQAESERLLANARSVLEVESSSTFSRPE